MDDLSFDALTRALGGSTNRRQVLGGAFAMVGAAVGLKVAGVDAARRGYTGPSAPNSPNGLTLALSTTSISGLCHVLVEIAGALPNARGAVALSAPGGDTWAENHQIATDADGRAQVISEHPLFVESVVIGMVVVANGDSTTTMKTLSC